MFQEISIKWFHRLTLMTYLEINQFVRLLLDHGAEIIKFYLYTSREEQLERFRLRENTAYKSWKLTDEDWRNRGKWEDYDQAAADMLLKTSTHRAPWFIVEADDKYYARVKVLGIVVDRLEAALK